MTLYLAKSLENIRMYGPIPDLGGQPEKVEEYNFGEEENEWLLNNLVDTINARCDSLLDDGDYDFFDVQKCNQLLEVLEELPENFVPEEYSELIRVLREYCIKAISNHTGIAIEL